MPCTRPSLRPLVAAACLVLAACRPFEFSPYGVPEDSGAAGGPAAALTADNLGRMGSLAKTAGKTFAFAVMADSHTDYDDLVDAVEAVNADSSIRFVVMAGDFTKYGLLREYEWFERAMSGLRAPWLTVIGNHDALADGARIYRRMFGDLDYAFTFQGVRFVCANTNRWEFDFRAPDWPWLERELATAADSLRLFVISHIAPFGDQFDPRARDEWTALMVRHGVDLSIHGHQHNYRLEETYGDGVPYLVADNVSDRNFVKVTVTPTGFAAERVWF